MSLFHARGVRVLNKARQIKCDAYIWTPVWVILMYLSLEAVLTLLGVTNHVIMTIILGFFTATIGFIVYSRLVVNRQATSIRVKDGGIVVSVVLLSLIWFITQCMSACILQYLPQSPRYADMVKNNAGFYIVWAIFFAPFVEELFYRGVVYGCWRERMPHVLAAVLSSFVFMAMHMTWQHIPTFAVGLFACLLFDLTDSLLAPFLAHVLYNAMSAGFFLLLPKPFDNIFITGASFAALCVFLCVLIWKQAAVKKIFIKDNEVPRRMWIRI